MIHNESSKAEAYRTQVLTAAGEGNPEAQYCLGLHYGCGAEGFEKNDEKAMYWLNKAAQQGYQSAMFALGVQYMNGKNCEADPELAFRWMYTFVTEASEKNIRYAHACEYVGTALLEGAGVERNPAAAAQWLCRAANLGLPSSQAVMGFLQLEEALGFYDPQQAREWFRMAAKAGNADGQRGLGMCYLLGEGVEQDVGVAAYFFRLAAEQGDEKAAKALEKYCGGYV